MKALKARWLVISSEEVKENSGFLFDDEEILDILSNNEIDELVTQGRVEEVIDASAEIVSAGFINAHMHQYGLISHGMVPLSQITNFDNFLSAYWWPDIEDQLRKEDLLAGTYSSAAELLHSGCVALCDILEAPFIEEDALIAQGEALEKIGMRAVVSLESSERAGHDNGVRCLEMNRAAVRHFKDSKLVNGAICTHTTFSCSEDFIRMASDMAVAEDAMLQFHLSESKYEPEKIKERYNTKPVKIYQSAEALRPTTLASQCVKVDEEEIALLAKYGVKAAHMPLSNCEVGGGIAPIPTLLEAGIDVGVGTDGYVNNFFELMRATFLIHKANHERTDIMPADTVFKMATELGAKAMGLPNSGLLRKGYVPDFVIIRTAYPTPVTLHNIYDQIVVYSDPAYVRDVYISGQPVVKDGEITTFDEAAAKETLYRRTEKLWADQGVQRPR